MRVEDCAVWLDRQIAYEKREGAKETLDPEKQKWKARSTRCLDRG